LSSILKLNCEIRYLYILPQDFSIYYVKIAKEKAKQNTMFQLAFKTNFILPYLYKMKL